MPPVDTIKSLGRSRATSLWLSRPALASGIGLLTLAVFAPALWNDFVNFDDPTNLLQNPHYRGLGWAQIRWMLTANHMGHWIPLTWLTFGLDYVLWGMNPFGYHLTNILLHAVNAGLFYLVARLLLGKAMTGLSESSMRLGGGMAALFFALHPMRAESVAWVTERRDVLAGVFFLLTILAYLQACDSEGASRRRWLAGSVGCYVLALAAKAIVATLPVLLIILDIYPLRRVGGHWRDWATREARSIWKEKVPFFFLALAMGGIAFLAVRVGAQLTPLTEQSLPARVAAALWSFWFYFWETLFPVAISPLHELPTRIDPMAPQFLWGGIAVGLLTGGFWLLRRRWPAGLAVWAAYVVILAPVSLQIHHGYQLTADRYSYLSGMGWALLAGAAIAVVGRALESEVFRPRLRYLAFGGAAVWIAGLAAITWNQVQVWRDSDTLWRYALERDSDCAVCHTMFGVSLRTQGLYAQAIEEFERALARKPSFTLARVNLAFTLLRAGEPAKASKQFQFILARYPDEVDARSYLAEALHEQGKIHEAVEQLELTLRQKPDHVPSLSNLGLALDDLGRPEEAVPYLQRAIALRPDLPGPRYGLARAYRALGRTKEAEEQLEVLRRLDRGLAQRLSIE